ncbi:MAG: peptide-methionine (S)-S-oxide reductase, partial [Caulobacteraceae bacterium]
IPAASEALPGRASEMPVPTRHFVNGAPMKGPFEGKELAMFALGCFWGAERKFWQAPGVFSTHVGYAAGHTPNPTYEEVCSGRTGHAEVVRVAFDPQATSYAALLKLFWENHDPTQGMRQGNDIGTQYRSGIYVYSDAQRRLADTLRSRPRSCGRRRSTTPRTTTSSTWRRTRTATAASAAPASRARSGSSRAEPNRVDRTSLLRFGFVTCVLALAASADAQDRLDPGRFAQPPRVRLCCAFGTGVRIDIGESHAPVVLDMVGSPQVLGHHSYLGFGKFQESNGLVYTCRGGFIDVAHVRETADWTAYLATRLRASLARGGTIALPGDGPPRSLRLSASGTAADADALSVALGQRIAYELMWWAELEQWAGLLSVA